MSRWSEVIQFATITEEVDSDGFSADVEVTGSNVFANRKDIRSSEFYQAAQNGIQLESMFEVRLADYNEQTKLKHNGKWYNVKRTYAKTDIIELFCSRFDGEVT